MADTTDAAQPVPQSGINATNTRLKKRRAAETRLKIYGMIAIGLAGLALATLLWSVVNQARGVLAENYITIEVPLSADQLGLDGDPSPAEIRRANFSGAITQALQERFPDAENVGGLISSGAAFELATRVAQNPDLIGQTVTARLLGADTTNLYLEDGYGALREVSSDGALTVTQADGGGVSISTTQDDFAGALDQVKASLTDDARRLRNQAARQQNAVDVYTERLESAETEEDRQSLQDDITSAEERRDELRAQAEDLEARARGAGGAEDLTRDTISAFIQVDGGWIDINRMGETSAEGQIVAPLSSDLPIEAVDDWSLRIMDRPEARRQISDSELIQIERLQEVGAIDRSFNWRFFSATDSRAPELAGIWGAIVGSALTMFVTFCLAFPVGVLAAIYLEEFAPKNRFTDFIEVNINNLAAVPSIVYGLLGLAVFLQFFGVPRSSPLAGGIVLALMTLPLMIISARASIRAVPPSIREAALGVGASKVQASFHHVLPLALPGIMTGTIIGMAQALGETAPLIMIGMVAFIVETPTGFTDSATVLPVQIFRWSDFPEAAFEAKAGAAICVLLIFLVTMNAIAVLLRKRFERRW